LLFGLVTVLGLTALNGLARRWHEETRLQGMAAASTELASAREAMAELPDERPESANELATIGDDGTDRGVTLVSTRGEPALATPKKPAVSAGVLNGRAIHYSVETTETENLLPQNLIEILLPEVYRTLERINGARQPVPEHVIWVPSAAPTTPEGQGEAELAAALSSEECAFVERCLLEVLQREAPRNLPRGDLCIEALNPAETIVFLRSDPRSGFATCTSRYDLSWVTRGDLVQWRASVSIPLVTPPPEPPPTTPTRHSR